MDLQQLKQCPSGISHRLSPYRAVNPLFTLYMVTKFLLMFKYFQKLDVEQQILNCTRRETAHNWRSNITTLQLYANVLQLGVFNVKVQL